jgi:hypothetical protein
MYEKVDNFVIFSQKFTTLDDKGQDHLVKAALRLFEAQKGIKSNGTSTSKHYQLEKKTALEEKR